MLENRDILFIKTFQKIIYKSTFLKYYNNEKK